MPRLWARGCRGRGAFEGSRRSCRLGSDEKGVAVRVDPGAGDVEVVVDLRFEETGLSKLASSRDALVRGFRERRADVPGVAEETLARTGGPESFAVPRKRSAAGLMARRW